MGSFCFSFSLPTGCQVGAYLRWLTPTLPQTNTLLPNAIPGGVSIFSSFMPRKANSSRPLAMQREPGSSPDTWGGMSDPRSLWGESVLALATYHFGPYLQLRLSAPHPKNCLLRGVASLCVQASALLYECGSLCASSLPSIARLLSTVHRSQAAVSLKTSTEGAIHWDVTRDWGRRLKGNPDGNSGSWRRRN